MKEFKSIEELTESSYVGFYHFIDDSDNLVIGLKTENSCCHDFFYYISDDIYKYIYDTIIKAINLLEGKTKENTAEETPAKVHDQLISIDALIEIIKAVKQ